MINKINLDGYDVEYNFSVGCQWLVKWHSKINISVEKNNICCMKMCQGETVRGKAPAMVGSTKRGRQQKESLNMENKK